MGKSMEIYGEGGLYASPLFSFQLHFYHTERSVSASELSGCYTEIFVYNYYNTSGALLELSFGISNCLAGKEG